MSETCQGTTDDGTDCQLPAGWGTDSDIYCKYHVPDGETCQGTTDDGTDCQLPAGWGTDNDIYCKYHVPDEVTFYSTGFGEYV